MKPVAYRYIDSGIHRAKRVGVGMVGVSLMALTGCVPSQQTQHTTNDLSSGNQSAENALNNPTPQNFPKPIIAEADLSKPATDPKTLPLATVPVKGLLQATRSDDRAQQVATNGGRDPFAGLQPSDLRLPGLSNFPASKTTQRAPVPVLPKQPAMPHPKPIAQRNATAPLSNLPTIPVRTSPIGNAAPMTFSPITPIVSPTDLADQVDITGVVQVGDRIMAIAKAPEETSARYVNSGDRLSGGRVIVREIRVGNTGQPTVVLEQNGHLVVKSIGANRIASVRSF